MDTTKRTTGDLLLIFYQAMDERNPALLQDLFAEEAEVHFPGFEVKGNAASIRSAIEGMTAAGLRTSHVITHLLEQGDLAMCEMQTINTVNEQVFHVRGAAVCETLEGRIKRLVTYLDASEMQAFISALNAANVWLLFKNSGGQPAPAS